jgi:hypothetical protein
MGAQAGSWRRCDRGGVHYNPTATEATGINNEMEIVGLGTGGAFVWQNGVLGFLTFLLPDATWTITHAYDINNLGQILARGVDSQTEQPSYLILTPLP